MSFEDPERHIAAWSVVQVTGLEPAASCSQSRRDTNFTTPGYIVTKYGADDQTRTDTALEQVVLKTTVSANSTTSACLAVTTYGQLTSNRSSGLMHVL